MPLLVEARDTPSAWAQWSGAGLVIPIDSIRQNPDCIRIALVNNMPDPALEDTEMQFFELLDSASERIPVRVKLYSLPGIPRGERGQERLSHFYFAFQDLWNSRFDALIITGTEPHTPHLRDEPYWSALAELLDWAERNTSSTILSCLAAHASALHGDGIERTRLADKQFGVFDFAKLCSHKLTGQAERVRFPHSRWNELRAVDLAEAGYVILTESAEAGVDCFIKQKKNSLFVHFQGHPEYFSQTLLKEYRRDIKRFLRRERETYPSMPQGYFSTRATKLLSEFREAALSNPKEEILLGFPDLVKDTAENGWHSCATSIYGNWLAYVNSRKLHAPAFVSSRSSISSGEYERSSAMQ